MVGRGPCILLAQPKVGLSDFQARKHLLDDPHAVG